LSTPLRLVKPSFLILIIVLSVMPSGAVATKPSAAATSSALCACCANTGDWYETTGRLQDYEMAELRRVRFGAPAKVYTHEGMDGAPKGIGADYLSFELSSLTSPRGLITLKFTGERGETGSLVLIMPKVATSFGTDMHDMPDGSAGPILYKEWRFDGPASGSGIFRKGAGRGTRFSLILQGRGNNCLSAEDFRNWRLDIKGPRASYAFYGALADPE
jgi:hypothetical protein